MRDELTLMELVDRYLGGELNASERAAIEERLRTNAELRELVEDQRALHGGMKRLALRPAVNKAYRSYKWGKWAPGIGGAAVIAILAVGGWMLAKDSGHSTEAVSDVSEQVEQLLTLSDTTGTGLPALVMMIDPKTDTTLITSNGLVLDIPQGAFVDEAGRAITKPVRVTLLEAIDGVDIMKAGLSTISGDTLLETGGMFYIDAQMDAKQVGIDPKKPLTVMVPSDNADPRMMLYEGVMTEDGIVDWQNPQPLPRTLVPVDISTLDFYPPGYLDKLAELGKDAGDKGYTDSLYWSFSGEYARYAFQAEAAPADSSWTDSLTNKPFARSADANSPGHMKGAFLFAANCSSCHHPERNLTGPALKGARLRWDGQGDIYAWIKNSSAYLKTGNRYANELFRKWNKSVMTPHDLSDAEIDQILRYVDMPTSAMSGRMGIDPAKVQSIWNERFNNTNLATREFEERMREIHRTCDDQVLDLYANNLDKNLSQLDSMAVRMGHGAFATFALRNDGRVQLPEHAAERLRKVYSAWSRRYAEAARRTQEEFYRKEAQADQQSYERQSGQNNKDLNQDRERFRREFDANLMDALRQLGIEKNGPTREPPITAYVANVTNPGWWNVDRAVFQATADRRDMQFTDKQTGKTATLTYTPITVEVASKESFSELRVYLIPKELNSYQRVVQKDGAFTENLNSLFEYDLVCMGRKNGQQFAASLPHISGRSNVSISMQPTSDEELQRMVRTPQVTTSLVNDLLEQARHLEWLEREAKRQQAKQAHYALRNALMPVVFPCWGEVDGAPAEDQTENRVN
jgi:mono/diheme cytochrome c family protein